MLLETFCLCLHVVGDGLGVHAAEERSEEAFGGEGELDFGAGSVEGG